MTPMTVLSGLAAALIALSPLGLSPAAVSAGASSETGPAVEASPAQPESPIDINTASVEELTQLPRVGEVTAERIVAWREENGPFKSKEELMNVDGIGERTYELIEPHVTVGSSGDPETGPVAGAGDAGASANFLPGRPAAGPPTVELSAG